MMNDEGYPVGSTRDGVDTSKHPEGIKNALKIGAEHKEYTNSETNMPCEAPYYAQED